MHIDTFVEMFIVHRHDSHDSTNALGKQPAIFCSNKNKNTAKQGNAEEVKEVLQKVKQIQCNLQKNPLSDAGCYAAHATGRTTTTMYA